MKIRPIILSGGSGTRLWPVSRKRHPKQFAELVGSYSLLSSTLAMLDRSDLFAPLTVLANEDHKFFVLDAVKGRPAGGQILLEPCGRNTAAAAIVAALAENDEAEHVLHLLIPSDHVITDEAAFFAAIKNASRAAEEGRIALFGIQPTYPETGYGYIQRGKPTGWPQVDAIKSFKEKPDVASAKTFMEQGALWNSGIFLYDPCVLMEEVESLAPDQARLCKASLENASFDLGCKVLEKKSYEQLENISFDYRVMENTERGVVVPCSIGWSDVGSWEALWQLGDKNDDGNVTRGAVKTLDVKNSYLRSDGPVIGVIGLDDIAVVATKDAVLVAPRARSQDVKNLVAALEAGQHKAATENYRTMRPWGSYEGVAHGNRFQVKHIIVRPHQSLSLQMHQHRAEHWVVVEGTALVERDDFRQTMFENESIFIPKGAKHRLSNPSDVDLHLVEVQSGDYLGEDDIVRFSDKYGRVGTPEASSDFTEGAVSSSPVTVRKRQ